MDYNPKNHPYTLHPTYTGPGCTHCGQPESAHHADNSQHEEYAAKVRQEIADGTGVVPGAVSTQERNDLGSAIYNFIFQLLDQYEAFDSHEAAKFAGFCEREFKKRFTD